MGKTLYTECVFREVLACFTSHQWWTSQEIKVKEEQGIKLVFGCPDTVESEKLFHEEKAKCMIFVLATIIFLVKYGAYPLKMNKEGR